MSPRALIPLAAVKIAPGTSIVVNFAGWGVASAACSELESQKQLSTSRMVNVCSFFIPVYCAKLELLLRAKFPNRESLDAAFPQPKLQRRVNTNEVLSHASALGVRGVFASLSKAKERAYRINAFLKPKRREDACALPKLSRNAFVLPNSYFGASELTIFSKRVSPRKESHIGLRRRSP